MLFFNFYELWKHSIIARNLHMSHQQQKIKCQDVLIYLHELYCLCRWSTQQHQTVHQECLCHPKYLSTAPDPSLIQILVCSTSFGGCVYHKIHSKGRKTSLGSAYQCPKCQFSDACWSFPLSTLISGSKVSEQSHTNTKINFTFLTEIHNEQIEMLLQFEEVVITTSSCSSC